MNSMEGLEMREGIGYCQNQVVMVMMTADNPIVDSVTGEAPV